ncbi:synaptogenesis protein syg-2-like [Dermacentor variabilis]|uniref:synaptogenesis protein syg-2-like n=1 Tax=Dermacentor variabilis TaxID=34621 RepID=UPI003F5C7A4C
MGDQPVSWMPSAARFKHTDSPEVVQALRGETARLPCRTEEAAETEPPLLLQWYRGSQLIYSVDSENVPLVQARHTVHSGAREERRLHFSVGRRPYRLSLGHVQPEDEDVYFCLVSFPSGTSINASVSLVVVVPPAKPVLRYISKEGVMETAGSVIGPFNEGERLVILCEVSGGHPSPTITWHVGQSAVNRAVTQLQDDKTLSWIELQRLERSHFRTEVTCAAASGTGTQPIKSSVAVDLHLKPHSVTIRGAHGPLSANYPAEVECEAVGSRPAANLTWDLDGVPLTSSALQDGGRPKVAANDVSVSVVRFTPSPIHNGRPLRCRAANPEMPDDAIEDSWTLDVHYKPKVQLTLGSHPRQWNIVEGHDLYLECRVDANPRIGDVVWRLDGKDLSPGRHVIMSNQSLVLQRVHRDSSGSYTCVASNRIGETESKPLKITVKHTPACNQSQTTVYAASRHEEVHIICDVSAEPNDANFRWTFNNSATKHELSSFTSSGGRSVLYYTARKDTDYGTFQCLANNSIGAMKTPCYFQIVRAGPLSSMYNCIVSNLTDASMQVDCQRRGSTAAGANGGSLPADLVAAEASTFRQLNSFQLEIRDALRDRIVFNATSEAPSFAVSSLSPGTEYVVAFYLVNQNGKFKLVTLKTSTLLASEERLRSGVEQRKPCCAPLGVLITTGVVLAFLLVVIALLVKYRTRLKLDKGSRKPESRAATGAEEGREMGEMNPESKYVLPADSGKQLSSSKERPLTYV